MLRIGLGLGLTDNRGTAAPVPAGQVNAGLAQLMLTTFQASVGAVANVNVGTAQLTLTPQAATIGLSVDVNVGTASLVLTPQAATITALGLPDLSVLSVSSQESDGDVPLTYTIDQNSDVHFVLSTSATKPTAAQVTAGQDHTGSAAPEAFTSALTVAGSPINAAITSTSLNSSYHIHAVVDGGADGDVITASGSPIFIDTTAPILSSPSSSNLADTTADGSVTSDSDQGTLYAGVWPTASTPSAADIIAGTGATYSTTDATPTAGANNFSATGLTASTAYKWHFHQVDDNANASNVASTAEFSTTAGGAFTPADLFTTEQGTWWEPSPTDCYTNDARTTNAVVGNNVASITDLSGNTVHASQTDTNYRPLLQQDGGSKYYAALNLASDDRLKHTLELNGKTWDLVVAYQPLAQDFILLSLSLTVNPWVLGGTSGSTNTTLSNGATINAIYFDNVLQTPANRGAVYTLGQASTRVHVNFTPTAAFGAPTIGKYHFGALSAPGDVYGVFLREGTMTSGERADLDTYMAGLL